MSKNWIFVVAFLLGVITFLVFLITKHTNDNRKCVTVTFNGDSQTKCVKITTAPLNKNGDSNNG